MLALKRFIAGLSFGLLAVGFLWTEAGEYGSAQMLARPGWAGSGIRSDAWWRHAVIWQPDNGDGVVDPDELSGELDALRSLGADAILVPAPLMDLNSAKGLDGDSDAVGPEWMESFDEMLREASTREIRVLVRLSGADPMRLSSSLRVWLNRGVAGFYVVRGQMSPEDYSVAVDLARKLVAGAPGSRVVLSEAGDNDPVGLNRTGEATRARMRQPGNLLYVDSSLSSVGTITAADLRRILDRSLLKPNETVDVRSGAAKALGLDQSQYARVLAAIRLALHPAALIDADELPLQQETAGSEGGGGELVEWYKHLIALHHSNATLRYGQATMLDFDAQNALAWVVYPSPGMGSSPPIVVVCNVASQPIELSLAAEAQVRSRGTFLHAILSSDAETGSDNLKSLKLKPFGVYIGELRR